MKLQIFIFVCTLLFLIEAQSTFGTIKKLRKQGLSENQIQDRLCEEKHKRDCGANDNNKNCDGSGCGKCAIPSKYCNAKLKRLCKEKQRSGCGVKDGNQNCDGDIRCGGCRKPNKYCNAIEEQPPTVDISKQSSNTEISPKDKTDVKGHMDENVKLGEKAVQHDDGNILY